MELYAGPTLAPKGVTGPHAESGSTLGRTVLCVSHYVEPIKDRGRVCGRMRSKEHFLGGYSGGDNVFGISKSFVGLKQKRHRIRNM